MPKYSKPKNLIIIIYLLPHRGYLYAFVRNYRIPEGMCRAFSKIVKGFSVPDHSTIHGRFKGKRLIVDSTGFRMGRTTEYVEYRYKLRRRKK